MWRAGTLRQLPTAFLIFAVVIGLYGYVDPTPLATAETAVSGETAVFGETAGTKWRSLEVDILRATNDQRSQRGLKPLVWEPRLADIARHYSQELLQARQLDHIDARGHGPALRVAYDHRRMIALVGENLAAFSGRWPTQGDALVEQMVQGWMDSPGHRRNILRPDYSHLGVGLALMGSELRCTQLFAATPTYLANDLPRRLETGSLWPLEFARGPVESPVGVSLAPLEQARQRERFGAPEFDPPAEWQVGEPPGWYRLRFYFRQNGRRFSVVDGPVLEVRLRSSGQH